MFNYLFYYTISTFPTRYWTRVWSKKSLNKQKNKTTILWIFFSRKIPQNLLKSRNCTQFSQVTVKGFEEKDWRLIFLTKLSIYVHVLPNLFTFSSKFSRNRPLIYPVPRIFPGDGKKWSTLSDLLIYWLGPWFYAYSGGPNTRQDLDRGTKMGLFLPAIKYSICGWLIRFSQKYTAKLL